MPLRRPSPPPVIRRDVGMRLLTVIIAGLLLAIGFNAARLIPSLDRVAAEIQQIRLWR